MKVVRPGNIVHWETEEEKKAKAIHYCTCPCCKSELEFMSTDVKAGSYNEWNVAYIKCGFCKTIVRLPRPADYYIMVEDPNLNCE